MKKPEVENLVLCPYSKQKRQKITLLFILRSVVAVRNFIWQSVKTRR
jgi:hypothetical protein